MSNISGMYIQINKAEFEMCAKVKGVATEGRYVKKSNWISDNAIAITTSGERCHERPHFTKE